MRIFKIDEAGMVKSAGAFTDGQLWALHGVHPDEYRKEFKPIRERRNAMIAEAVKKAESLGHKLFRNWTPLLNSNRCRKCGQTVALANVLVKTNAPNHYGGAVTYRCNSHLDHVPENYFEISDVILDSGTQVNKEQLTAIAGG